MTTIDPTSLAGLGGVGAGNSTQNREQLEKAAEEFEAVFLAQVMNGLTAGLEGEGSLANAESDPFAGMLQQEYAKLISKSGGVGVGDAVLKEMLKLQEIE